ncbi:DUF1311 domain-containing protein [Shewanella sp. SG44-6]|jgi:uncharacterized protein YecT (DUF1311 family)|uniref:lysozyme inhibitor LprI family protein n=1 Tax=Shewanella sp. SG44-6 TaxID=2760959 RepID=UPI00160264BF|nr:lysozyme inhibitor LprI family protein [Shewanella sp. SG44-6]MBB1391797.1 DUF1311 domain-containing protein [Shewanella sp. SG44-6]
MKAYMAVGLLSFTLIISGASRAQETEHDIYCDAAMSTVDINQCARQEFEVAQVRLDEYIAKASDTFHDDPVVLEALQLSQRDWLTYRESYCHAIYQLWRGGTIRGVMYQGCMLQLTVQRTHNIWQNYLTYMDSSEPILPEPQ